MFLTSKVVVVTVPACVATSNILLGLTVVVVFCLYTTKLFCAVEAKPQKMNAINRNFFIVEEIKKVVPHTGYRTTPYSLII